MVIVIIALIVVAVSLVCWSKSKRKGKDAFLEKDAPRDTVILHQFGPAPFVPSVSPFVIKLETFLRVSKIPYENRFKKRLGPKGKIPWIQYNQDVVPDSQHCIEFLNKTCNVDLNKRLTSHQLAIGHVIRRTLEEWMFWMLVSWRLIFIGNSTLYHILGLPGLVIWYIKRVSRSRVMSQGIGLHSQDEVVAMLKQDLKALDELLGDKKFLFGNQVSDVTEFDCSLFGHLCQLLWQTPGCCVKNVIQEKYPRLVDYCVRMKESFWPDWDERLQKPKNQQLASMTSDPEGLIGKDTIIASNLSFAKADANHSCGANNNNNNVNGDVNLLKQ